MVDGSSPVLPGAALQQPKGVIERRCCANFDWERVDSSGPHCGNLLEFENISRFGNSVATVTLGYILAPGWVQHRYGTARLN